MSYEMGVLFCIVKTNGGYTWDISNLVVLNTKQTLEKIIHDLAHKLGHWRSPNPDLSQALVKITVSLTSEIRDLRSSRQLVPKMWSPDWRYLHHWGT